MAGFIGGTLYALAFNIPSTQFGAVLGGNGSILAIILGQFALWACVGMLLAARLHIAGLFSELGKSVPL